MSGLASLPTAKWALSGKQPGVKQDPINWETAILQCAGNFFTAPTLIWVDNTAVRVKASADLPAQAILSGFPNIWHPGSFADFGLVDGRYRRNTSNVSFDFDSPSTFLGTEKSSQWYAVFATAADAATTFTLLGVPWMRVSSQATQTITLRNNLNTANIGYGFSTNSLANYKILMIRGSSAGQVRTITANNNNNSTGGTITYSGTALTLTQGDWFIVLPNTNFRWLGDVRNNSSGHIARFTQSGERFDWYDVSAAVTSTASYNANLDEVVPPLAATAKFSSADDTPVTSPNYVYPGGTPDNFEVNIKDAATVGGSGQNGLNIYCYYYRYPEGYL